MSLTFLEFHLVFVLPPLLLLALLAHRRRAMLPPRARWALLVLALIALAYAAPWANYLAFRGVWQYGVERAVAIVGYVPLEEYVYLILQPALTGLCFYWLLGHRHASDVEDEIEDAKEPPPLLLATPERGPLDASRSPALFWAAATAAGAGFLQTEQGTYIGLILVWACPVLAAQWLYAGGEILRLRRPVLLALATTTLYLCLADRVALSLGIWSIAERFSTGLRLFGLPLEQATFFLLTNLLIIQGLVLLLYPRGRAEAVSAVTATGPA